MDFDAEIIRTADPFALFADWLAEAEATESGEVNAMTLASVGADGAPSARIVLLKAHDRRGFVFYTNLTSRKGDELAANNQAALCFHWQKLERQVRVEGAVVSVDEAEADAYFASRHPDSRIGAHSSQQSQPLKNRAALEAAFAAAAAQFAGGDVPRPPHWSGFRLVPRRIEFWQSGAHRLHDRLVFIRAREDAAWHAQRLFP